MDNRFNPVELYPKARAWVVRDDERGRGADVMAWEVLGGMAKWPMTNVRDLALPQWRRLAEKPENRCLIPVTEFAEWTPVVHDVGGGKPIKGEMWFAVPDQPVFAIAGFWQAIGDVRHFAMVTVARQRLDQSLSSALVPGEIIARPARAYAVDPNDHLIKWQTARRKLLLDLLDLAFPDDR